jgi:hypothetical protein
MDSLQLAKNLVKTVVPARSRSALRRMAHQWRVRGKPFLVISDVAGIALGSASHIAADMLDARCSSRLRTEPVQIVALDDVVPEGRCRPAVVMETLPEEAWIARNLTLLGYRLGERLAENVVLACT